MAKINESIRRYCRGRPSSENIFLVLNVSLDNIRTIDKLLASRTLYIAVLCGGLELLRQASVTEVQVFGARLTEYGVIERIIPAVVSLLFLSCFALLAGRRVIEGVFDSFVEGKYPTLADSGLALYLRPAHFMKTYRIVLTMSEGWLQSLISMFGGTIILFVYVAIPAFCVYSFSWLFKKHGYGDILTIISAALSALFILQGYLIGYSAQRAMTASEDVSTEEAS